MTERCTVGVKFVRDEQAFTTFHYDYTNQCPGEAVGTSALGFPRCSEHEAHRYLVTVGTSLTITKNRHDRPEDACTEILHRLPSSLQRYPDLERMTARPATATDIERFEALASQTLASVTVVGPPR